MSLGFAPLAAKAGDGSTRYDGVALPALWASAPDTPQKAADAKEGLKLCQNDPYSVI